jgi:hypothetical protein
MKIYPPLSEDVFSSIDFDEKIIELAITAAASFVEDTGYDIPQGPEDVDPSGTAFGATFQIPIALPEGIESGDGRSFDEESLSSRNLPLPLMWQIKTGPGHDGAVVVGRIDSIERVGNGLGNVEGVFDVGPYGREAERMVRNGFLRGVSADLDKFEGTALKEVDADDESELTTIKSKQINVNKARLMGITIVPKPAFEECLIMIKDPATMDTGDDTVPDGLYEDNLDDMDNELAALAASAAPLVPPKSWFENPKLNGPQPLTVTDDGQVFGHVATWNSTHIGLPRATRPPRSQSNYAYFRKGLLRTDTGEDVRVGQLTLTGGHAPLQASANEAVKHYDDTRSAVADVTAGEDQHGIWVAGSLRPDVTPNQVRAFRASAQSGDWRPINGKLELVAVCSVNVPGFPIARPQVLVAGGQVQALVAAGALPTAEYSRIDELSMRLDAMEAAELSAKREEALKRLTPFVETKEMELAALAASARQRMEPIIASADADLAKQMAALAKRVLGASGE